MIEQWDALTQYFQVVVDTDNLLVSQKILTQLRNPVWKLYFHFLNFVLPKLTELNLMFQSMKTSLHCLHTSLQMLYQDFLSCYLQESYWHHIPLKDIDPASQVNKLPLSSMYMGAQVTICLSKEEYKARAVDVQHFLRQSQEFYVEAALQIRQRFPIGDETVENLQVLDPNVSHLKFPSLVPIASRFPNIISTSKLQKLDDKWRKLSLVTLPFEYEDMDPELFWGELATISDGTGVLQFSCLSSFMRSL